MNLLAAIALTATMLAGAPPEFDPQEKISLDLKDASVTDVITLLGALANVPVSIAPDVTGTLSLQVKDTPYAKVLESLATTHQLWIRFEGGKLVATRSPVKVYPGSVPAPVAALEGPRIAVEAYSRSASRWNPLAVRLRSRAVDACVGMSFESNRGYEIPLPGSSEGAIVTQFGWDAVTRTRFVAVETPHGKPRAFSLSEEQGLALESARDGANWSVTPAPADVPCNRSAGAFKPDPSKTVSLRIQVTEEGGAVVMAPQLNAAVGEAFSMRSGIAGALGQHDETVLFGYLTSDGKSLAYALQATAIRTDPREGREYIYSQTPPPTSIRFIPVESFHCVALPSGPLRSKPLELWVSTASER